MYAMIEKIPKKQSQVFYQDNPIEYFHWKVLALFPDSVTARESCRIWSNVLGWYNEKDLDYEEVPGYVVPGRTYGLMDIEDIKRDARTWNKYGDSNNHKVKPSIGVKIGAYRGVHKISDPSPIKTIPYNYEIEEDKGMITIYYLHDDMRSVVARVKGYKGIKGMTRAKREIQYLEGEEEDRDYRVMWGEFPIISPDGIVTSRVNRLEQQLCAEV